MASLYLAIRRVWCDRHDECEHVSENVADAINKTLDRIDNGTARTPSYVGLAVSEHLATQASNPTWAFDVHEEVKDLLGTTFGWGESQEESG
jgi:hypothetical protein